MVTFLNCTVTLHALLSHLGNARSRFLHASRYLRPSVTFQADVVTSQAPTSVFALTIHVFRGAFGDP
eukprot:2738947-Rhodomonas_salina.2